MNVHIDDYYMNAYVELYDDYMMLQLNDVYMWDYNVESLLLLLLLLLLSLMSHVVVDYVVESMHTHIKLGAHALLNVNHSKHVDLRAYGCE